MGSILGALSRANATLGSAAGAKISSMGMCKAITWIICLAQSIRVPDRQLQLTKKPKPGKMRPKEARREGRARRGDCNFTAVSEEPAEALSFH